MILIAAENRELDALDINQPKESQTRAHPGTGNYLALTFGTLLSSQRADAQKLDPSGPRPWLDVQHYAGFQSPRTGGLARRTSRSARRRENTTRRFGAVHGGSRPAVLRCWS